MRPAAAVKELLNKLADHIISRRLTKREKASEDWKARGTEAWNSRLPTARSSKIASRNTHLTQNLQPQLLAPFFRKLPLEIRMLIYECALADHVLLFQVTNEEMEINCDEGRNFGIPFQLVCHTEQTLLSFPATCKLAYEESFTFMYARNTFQIAGVTEYWCMTRLVPRDHLDLIQVLHVQFSYPTRSWPIWHDRTCGFPPVSRDFWKETWKHISTLKGLKHVIVDIHRYDARVDDEDEATFFSPLEYLRKDIEAEVRVNWQKPSQWMRGNIPDEAYPFTVRRDVVYQKEENGIFSLATV